MLGTDHDPLELSAYSFCYLSEGEGAATPIVPGTVSDSDLDRLQREPTKLCELCRVDPDSKRSSTR